MTVYHYLPRPAFVDAHRRAALGGLRHGPLLFAPNDDWAPTFFREYGNYRRLRAASRQEMLSVGLYRFGTPHAELPLVSQLRYQDLLQVEPQLDALALVGVEPLGWRVMLNQRSTFDVVSDKFVRGQWRRITALLRTSDGPQVLDDVPVLPVPVARNPRP